jgi:hypothetical protein
MEAEKVSETSNFVFELEGQFARKHIRFTFTLVRSVIFLFSTNIFSPLSVFHEAMKLISLREANLCLTPVRRFQIIQLF